MPLLASFLSNYFHVFEIHEREKLGGIRRAGFPSDSNAPTRKSLNEREDISRDVFLGGGVSGFSRYTGPPRRAGWVTADAWCGRLGATGAAFANDSGVS